MSFVAEMQVHKSPRKHYAELYRRRIEVERFNCIPTRFHRIDTRSDGLDIIFLAAIHLSLIYDMLNQL